VWLFNPAILTSFKQSVSHSEGKPQHLSRQIWLPWKLESHVTLVTSIHSRTGDDIKVTVASRRRRNQNNNKVCFDHDFNSGSSSAIKTTTTDEPDSECCKSTS
jgi:hypothetical protein